jgi:hypothetical protein
MHGFHGMIIRSVKTDGSSWNRTEVAARLLLLGPPFPFPPASSTAMPEPFALSGSSSCTYQWHVHAGMLSVHVVPTRNESCMQHDRVIIG